LEIVSFFAFKGRNLLSILSYFHESNVSVASLYTNLHLLECCETCNVLGEENKFADDWLFHQIARIRCIFQVHSITSECKFTHCMYSIIQGIRLGKRSETSSFQFFCRFLYVGFYHNLLIFVVSILWIIDSWEQVFFRNKKYNFTKP
jgi:hypothetical protein